MPAPASGARSRQRPSPSVTPATRLIHPSPCVASRRISIPAAGLPNTASSTCVVILLMHQPLSQTNLQNLPLLFGGFPQFSFSIAGQPPLQDSQHLIRTFSGSADDVS